MNTHTKQTKKRASPLMIRMALAYYYSPEPKQSFGHLEWDSESAGEARNWLYIHGMVDAAHNPTDKLKAYVEHLCAQPLPKEVSRYETEGVST